jgi:tetratricopeptide (TPR) repeat protein
MKPQSARDGMRKFKDVPFSVLVRDDRELFALRAEYASVSASERRKASDWEYHSQISVDIVNNAAQSAQSGLETSSWPPGIIPLAIDPLYAPAILTVGSIEYQIGRVDEAMKLFLILTTLPKDEEDLTTIIDKAGDFLIDQDDYENALALYSAAEKAFPDEVVYLIGSGYCLGQIGRYEDSVEKHRRADALEPDNYKHLNDLGYSLFETGRLDEAKEILEKSISLAPQDYEFPRNNLAELQKRRA